MDIFMNFKSISISALLIPIATFLLNLGGSSSFSSAMTTTSIFDFVLSSQIPNCSSFSSPRNRSTTQAGIKYPSQSVDILGYEFILTSPNFNQGTYPDNLDCISLIKAPNDDYRIMMEMRERFDIEPSKECNSDFLEIRDGPFGFSKFLGKYCNLNKMPKQIVSTGSFLWMRFVSDISLATSGFKLVYKFIRKGTKTKTIKYCYKQIKITPGGSFNLNHSFVLPLIKQTFSDRISAQSSSSSSSSSPTQMSSSENKIKPYECVIDVFVPSNYHTFVFQSKYVKRKESYCEYDYVKIYHKTTKKIPVSTKKKISNYYRICDDDKSFKQRYFDDSYKTTFRISFSTLRKTNRFVFQITSTLLKKECPVDYFNCQDSICIHNNLLCNQEINCPSQSDEKCVNNRILKPGEEVNITITTPKVKSKKQRELERLAREKKQADTMHGIILGSMAAVLIIFFIVCFLLTMHSRKKERMKIQNGVATVAATQNHTGNNHHINNKKMYYEQLHMSEPSINAVSTDKSMRKFYENPQQSVWSRRDDDESVGLNMAHAASVKLNGGLQVGSTGTSGPTREEAASNKSNYSFLKNQRIKRDKSKNSSLNKIGKYLSEPNPPKNESFVTSTTTISNNTIGKQPQQQLNNTNNFNLKSNNHTRPNTADIFYNIPPVTTATNTKPYNNNTNGTNFDYIRHKSSTIDTSSSANPCHIQRAASMGSGLRKILDKDAHRDSHYRHHHPYNDNDDDDDDDDEGRYYRDEIGRRYEHDDDDDDDDIQWYCGPIISRPSSGSFNRSSELILPPNDALASVGLIESRQQGGANNNYACNYDTTGVVSTDRHKIKKPRGHAPQYSHHNRRANANNNQKKTHHTNPSIIDSHHVPGCRSLPNVSHFGRSHKSLQIDNTATTTTKSNTPISSCNNSTSYNQHVPVKQLRQFDRGNSTASSRFYYNKPLGLEQQQYPELTTDYSEDDSSSYRNETPTFSMPNQMPPNYPNSRKQSVLNSTHYPRQQIAAAMSYNTTDNDETDMYGLKYYCAHEPFKITNSNNNNNNNVNVNNNCNNNNSDDFVEYIA